MPDVPGEVREIADLVDARIATLLDEQRKRWIPIDPRLGEAIDELERMASGGKRLRAAFCYHAWLGAGGAAAATDRVVDVGAACELLQTFALIHDDIMDAANTRRGEETIHIRQGKRLTEAGWQGEPRRYGEGVALLVGDLSHAYADHLIGTDHPRTRQLWDELRIELNLGQYLDMRAAAAREFDRETAQRVAMFKSALYTIVRPLQLGAALATEIDDDVLHQQLETFGRPVGQAFQLRDDLLGVIGDADRVGKPVGDDLREGKATELVAVARERADSAQRLVLDRVGAAELSALDVEAIVDVLHTTGAVAEINRRIDGLVAAAADAALALPFDPSVRATLMVLANYVADRNH